MGENQTENTRPNERSRGDFITEIIKGFYDELLQYDLELKDLYLMTIKELESTLINRRKGLAYKIWRLSTFVHSPLVKEFPTTPKEAMPELYPIEKGIPMPEFLKEKAIKRGVI